jgi:hypothetical protein
MGKIDLGLDILCPTGQRLFFWKSHFGSVLAPRGQTHSCKIYDFGVIFAP